MDDATEMEKLAARLRAYPPVEKSNRKLNKQQKVKCIAAEIALLKQRGYTIDQVAEILRGEGLDISTPTLKSYLQRVKKKPSRAPSRRPPTAAATPAQQPGGSTINGHQEAPARIVGDAKTQPPNAPGNTNSEFIATDRKRL